MPENPSDSSALAADAHLFIVDDEGMVFSESAQEIHALNTAATFIWCCAEEGMSAAQIAHRMSYDLGLSAPDAQDQVAGILRQWRGLGLIAGSENAISRITSKKSDEITPPPADMLPWTPPCVVAERRYRMLTTTVAVRFTEREQEAWVHPVLAHLKAEGAARADRSIDVIAAAGSHLIYLDGQPRARCDGLNRIAPWVKSLFCQTVIRNYDYFLQIHAGVVGMDGRCILLPGAPGQGKSTLTAALIHAGFAYFSDEVALLEHTHFRVRPIPLSMAMKSTGWDILSPYFPELGGFPVHHRIDGKVLRYLPLPQSVHQTDPETACPVSHIIFPGYREGVETQLVRLPRVAAMRRLMEECVAIPRRLTVESVAGLAQWIKSVEFYELPLSSADDAVALARRAVGSCVPARAIAPR